ncbi:MAG: tetratricopeptide repeat protein [Phycisphaerae bacterium]
MTKKNEKKVFAVFLAMLFSVVIAAHRPVLSTNTLCFDDDQYLTNNILVQNPSLNSAKRFLAEVFEPSTVGGYYQPLAMISLMLDYRAADNANDLRPFHRTSLGLHAANAVLVALILYTVFGNIWIALICGLLFGLHPMTIETIALVSERKTVLATFFAFWSIFGYVNYVKAAKRRVWFYFLAFMGYVLALLSKPTPIALPLLFILLDWWPFNRLNLKTMNEKVPFFVVAILSAVVTFISQTTVSPANIAGGYGVQNIWLVLCHNIVFYPLNILWPVNLSSFYPFPEPFNLSNPALIGSVIGAVIIITLLVITAKWTKSVLVCWLIFFVVALPTMQIVQFSNVIASDKFAYLPSIGFLLLLAYGLKLLWQKNKVLLKVAVISGAVILASAETAATRKHLLNWTDTVTYCEYMLTRTPGSAGIHYLLGNAYREAGRFDEAIKHYEIVLAKEPDVPANNCNYGIILAQTGRLDEAIEYFRKAIAEMPEFEEAHYNLGNALRLKGDIAGAIAEYEKTLECEGEYVKAYNNLGAIYMEQKQLDKAIGYFRKAIECHPNYATAYNNLGISLVRKGQIDEAIVNYKKALEIAPDYTSARLNLNSAIEYKNKQKQAE